MPSTGPQHPSGGPNQQSRANSRAVLTQHNDVQRSGAYRHETRLDWKNVNVNKFGKLCEHPVEGFVWAQPLFVPGVHMRDGEVKDLVIVATSENWVYALDASDATGDPKKARLWARRIGEPAPSGAFRPDYGDMYHTRLGILGTPVIDLQGGAAEGPVTGTIYLAAMTWDAEIFDGPDPEKAFKYLLVALDLSTGRFRRRPVTIGGAVEGCGYLGTGDKEQRETARREGGRIVVEGEITRDRQTARQALLFDWDERRTCKITDGVVRNGKDFVQFNAMMQLQRPGLLLCNGVIYIAFGSHADFDPYHGWVFAYDAGTLRRRGVFCTSQNGMRAGIWQAGEGISADEAGNIYVGTGNGDIIPAAGCYGDSLLKLKLEGDRLTLLGFSNAFEELGKEDEDFGASSPTMLGDGMMAGGGKDGHFYLFAQDKMDPAGSPESLRQLFRASYDEKSRPAPPYSHHIHGSPVVFRSGEHTYLYIWPENEVMRCFEYDPAKKWFPGQPDKRNSAGSPAALGMTYCSSDGEPDSMHGGFLSVSANGETARTGIVWAAFAAYRSSSQAAVRGELRAYKADGFEPDGSGNGVTNAMSQKRLVTLWSSRCNRRRDDLGAHAKFCCPTIAGGRVYQATFNHPGALAVYGLLPHCDGGYDIGFGGRTRLVFNGDACIENKRVRLIEALHVFQAGSVFHDELQDVSSFQTTFTFRAVVPPNLPDHNHPDAEGFTFTIQRQSPHALGGLASGLGYGPDLSIDEHGLSDEEKKKWPRDRGAKIDHSVAVKFGLRNSVLGFYCKGKTPSGGRSERPAGTDLRHKTRVTIRYEETTLTITVEDLGDEDADVNDPAPRYTAKHCIKQDLAAEEALNFGGEPTKAYVGFTAGSGPQGTTVDIIKWEFHAPAPPYGDAGEKPRGAA